MSAIKPQTATQMKAAVARRKALSAALAGKTQANSASLALSYAIPLSEVQSAMRSMGVSENG